MQQKEKASEEASFENSLTLLIFSSSGTKYLGYIKNYKKTWNRYTVIVNNIKYLRTGQTQDHIQRKNSCECWD